MALAGFSAGEAEGLRRAMSRKRSEEAILVYRDRFIDGAVERGGVAGGGGAVFEQVRGFSGFGFPKAHAVAFGLLAYQSTWLRVHYAPEFLCSLLNEQPMGFYPPDALVHEAQRRGIEVLPPDVNRSGVECVVEMAASRALGGVGDPRPMAFGIPTAVRIGPGLHNRAALQAGALVAERERGGQYAGLADLASRSGLAARDSSCWRGRGRARRWGATTAPARRSLAAGRRRAGRRCRGAPTGRSASRPDPFQLSLPSPSPRGALAARARSWERLVADYASTGIALAEHPMALLRPTLERRGPQRRARADLGRAPREVAGLVVARQRPATARGGGVHAARGRAGDGQRGGPAAGLRAPSPGGADGVVRAGERKARAPRGSGERGCVVRASARHSRPATRGRQGHRGDRGARSGRAGAPASDRRRMPAPRISPPSPPPRTASAGVDGERLRRGDASYVARPNMSAPIRSLRAHVRQATSARPPPAQRGRSRDRLRNAWRVRPRELPADGPRPGHAPLSRRMAGWEAFASARRGACRARHSPRPAV